MADSGLDTVIFVRIDINLKERLQALAKRNEQSVAQFVRLTIRERCDAEEKKAARASSTDWRSEGH